MTLRKNEGARLTAVLALALTASVGVTSQAPPKPSMTVYKTASCGCCAKWVEHVRAEGFEVNATNVEDIGAVKAKNGVSTELASCHTSLVGGYVVEGHVPADAVKRLLREKPKVAGIAVPGMPVGSPGMEQPGRREPYSIISFDKAGKAAVYDRR